MVWYGMVWCGMVWYGMVWYGMVWYGMVWFDGLIRMHFPASPPPRPRTSRASLSQAGGSGRMQGDGSCRGGLYIMPGLASVLKGP